jgi:hypothetical protein
MISWSDLSDALQSVRLQLVSSLVPCLVQRLESNGSDQGPILVRASRSQLCVEAIVRQSAQLLKVDPLFIRSEQIDHADPKADIKDFLTRLRQSHRLIVLTNWEKDRDLSAQVLAAVMESKKEDAVVLILTTENSEDHDPDVEVGTVIGNELWRELTYIQIDAPAVLDDDGIERLGTQATH